MSLTSEKQRVENARNRIRNHLVSLGVAEGYETIDMLAALVENLSSGTGEDDSQAIIKIRNYLVTLGIAEGDETADEVAELVESLSANGGGGVGPGVVGDLYFSHIKLTPPTKDSYQLGEKLDLTGVAVTAYYGRDVTDVATLNLQNGTVLSEENGMLTATYTEDDETKEDSVFLLGEAMAYVVYGDDSKIQYFTDINNLVNQTDKNTQSVNIGGTSILKNEIKEVHLCNKFESIPNYFCGFFINLIKLDGLSGVKTIGNEFLLKCTSFNQDISIPESVISIDYDFLSGCTAFNGKVSLPSTLEKISGGFLIGCSSFNQPLTIPAGVKSIEGSMGRNFLGDCKAFNKPLVLPNTLQSIGNYFMSGCSSFNQPLTFPASITSVGSGSFMANMDSLTSTITVNCAPPASYDANSFSTTNVNAPIYVNGVTFAGTRASDWITKYPNRTTSPYRKINGK